MHEFRRQLLLRITTVKKLLRTGIAAVANGECNGARSSLEEIGHQRRHVQRAQHIPLQRCAGGRYNRQHHGKRRIRHAPRFGGEREPAGNRRAAGLARALQGIPPPGIQPQVAAKQFAVEAGVGFRQDIQHLFLALPHRIASADSTRKTQPPDCGIVPFQAKAGNEVAPFLTRDLAAGSKQRSRCLQGTRVAEHMILEFGPDPLDLGIEVAPLLALEVLAGVAPCQQRQCQGANQRQPCRPEVSPGSHRSGIVWQGKVSGGHWRPALECARAILHGHANDMNFAAKAARRPCAMPPRARQRFAPGAV